MCGTSFLAEIAVSACLYGSVRSAHRNYSPQKTIYSKEIDERVSKKRRETYPAVFQGILIYQNSQLTNNTRAGMATAWLLFRREINNKHGIGRGKGRPDRRMDKQSKEVEEKSMKKGIKRIKRSQMEALESPPLSTLFTASGEAGR